MEAIEIKFLKNIKKQVRWDKIWRQKHYTTHTKSQSVKWMTQWYGYVLHMNNSIQNWRHTIWETKDKLESQS